MRDRDHRRASSDEAFGPLDDSRHDITRPGTLRQLGVALAVALALSICFAAPAVAQYDCNDPQVRAALPYLRDALAQLAAAYNQMPAAVRQQMDASMRQQTGYSVLQATQILTECVGGGTVPVPAAPLGDPNVPVPPAADNTVPVPVTPRVLSPEQYRVALPKLPYAAMDLQRLGSSLAHVTEPAVSRAQGGPFAAVPLRPVEPQDGVPIGGLHFSLCFQLYHRTDCSDTQAAATYSTQAGTIIDGLTKKMQAADDEVGRLEHQLQLFQDAKQQQDTTKLVASMREDNQEFMKVRDDALRDATLGLATVAADAGIDAALRPDTTGRRLTAGDVTLLTHDLPGAAAMLGERSGTGQRLDALDRESLAETLVGVGTSATSHAAALSGAASVAEAASGIGTGVTIGMSALRIAAAVALDYEVQKIDRAIIEPQQRLAQYQADLEGRLAMARQRQQQVGSELAGQQQMLAEVAAYPKQ